MSSYDKTKVKYRNYGNPWSKDLDQLLETLFMEGKTIEQLMVYFGRNEGSLRARLEKLQLVDPFTNIPKYDPKLLKEKEDKLNKEIKTSMDSIRDLYNSISRKQVELMDIVEKKTSKGLEYDVMDNMLKIAITDMVNNGWYPDVETAIHKLLSRT